jgi:hypothetical protein
VTANDGSSRDVGRVSGEIDTLRQELGRLVGELDRRRHELLDVKLQIRRHPVAVAVTAGAAALLLGGVVGMALRRRRQHARPAIRAREARRALARLLDHPERVAHEQSTSRKIAAAAGVAVGSVVARRLAERFIGRTTPRR